MLFAFVIVRGAPYVPTRRAQAEQALDLLDLKPGDTFLDLGSGDGAVLKVAAERGILAIGYELNPILVIISRLRLRKYKEDVAIIWGDSWVGPWPQTDGIYIFQMGRYMKKVEDKLHRTAENDAVRSFKVATYGFKLPKTLPTKFEDPYYLYTFQPPLAKKRAKK